MSKNFTKSIDNILFGEPLPEKKKEQRRQEPEATGKRGRPKKEESDKVIRYTFVTDPQTIERVKAVMWKVKKTKIKDVINTALIEYLEKHER